METKKIILYVIDSDTKSIKSINAFKIDNKYVIINSDGRDGVYDDTEELIDYGIFLTKKDADKELMKPKYWDSNKKYEALENFINELNINFDIRRVFYLTKKIESTKIIDGLEISKEMKYYLQNELGGYYGKIDDEYKHLIKILGLD